jgi:hypothetical protein
MNCICDFSISDYFAELDEVHVPSILVAEYLQRASRRTGCGIFLPIITGQRLKLRRLPPFVFPTPLCGGIAFLLL